jgi:hypothetical protein
VGFWISSQKDTYGIKEFLQDSQWVELHFGCSDGDMTDTEITARARGAYHFYGLILDSIRRKLIESGALGE